MPMKANASLLSPTAPQSLLAFLATPKPIDEGLFADSGSRPGAGRVVTVCYLLDTNIVSELVRHP